VTRESPGSLVAAVQYEPQRGKPDSNRNRLLFLLRQAIMAEVELIVLPEMCTSGYIFPDRESILPYCEGRDGRTVRLFSSEARKWSVTVCFGWPELDKETGKLYNSAAVCFPNGEIQFYRKKLLFEADETWADIGDTPYPVWTAKNGSRCCLGICMDLNDDRFIQFLIEEKIRIIAFPTNWLDQGFKVWNYWAWRLRDTHSCLVAANRYGEEDETPFCGDSAVLDGRTLLGWAEEDNDQVVLARIPVEPTPFVEVG